MTNISKMKIEDDDKIFQTELMLLDFKKENLMHSSKWLYYKDGLFVICSPFCEVARYSINNIGISGHHKLTLNQAREFLIRQLKKEDNND